MLDTKCTLEQTLHDPSETHLFSHNFKLDPFRFASFVEITSNSYSALKYYFGNFDLVSCVAAIYTEVVFGQLINLLNKLKLC